MMRIKAAMEISTAQIMAMNMMMIRVAGEAIAGPVSKAGLQKEICHSVDMKMMT
jgi:hypothetical protein